MNEPARDLVRFAEQALELFAIFVQVDGFLRDSGIHGGFSDSAGFANQNARIKRLGNEVVSSKTQAVDTVSATNSVRNIFLRKIGQGMSGGEFHLMIDGGSANVERSAEDERESQNIVDLVGIVGATGGEDHIRACLLGVFKTDLRIRIRHGKNDRSRRHGSDHILINCSLYGASDENVGPAHGVGQSACVGVADEPIFIRVHALAAALVENSLGIAEK